MVFMAGCVSQHPVYELSAFALTFISLRNALLYSSSSYPSLLTYFVHRFLKWGNLTKWFHKAFWVINSHFLGLIMLHYNSGKRLPSRRLRKSKRLSTKGRQVWFYILQVSHSLFQQLPVISRGAGTEGHVPSVEGHAVLQKCTIMGSFPSPPPRRYLLNIEILIENNNVCIWDGYNNKQIGTAVLGCFIFRDCCIIAKLAWTFPSTNTSWIPCNDRTSR